VLRFAWAVPAFAVSLVAVVIQFGYLIFGMQMVQRLGAAASLPFPLVIFSIGVLLLWIAIHPRNNGWIR
jgi:fucose permease